MSVSRRLGFLLALLAVAKGQTNWTPVTVGSAASGGVRWIVRGETSRAAGSARVIEEATAAHPPSSLPRLSRTAQPAPGLAGTGPCPLQAGRMTPLPWSTRTAPSWPGPLPKGAAPAWRSSVQTRLVLQGAGGQLGSVAQGVCKA